MVTTVQATTACTTVTAATATAPKAKPETTAAPARAGDSAKVSPIKAAPLPATIWRTANEKPTALTWGALGAATLAGSLTGAKLLKGWEGAAFGAAAAFILAAGPAAYAVTGKVPDL